MKALPSSRRARPRWAAIVTAVLLVLTASLVATAPANALSDTGTGGQFVPTSGRIADAVTIAANTWTTVQVAGQAGVPDDGSAGAVVINATVAGMPNQGQLQARPDTSTTSTLVVTYDGGGIGTTSGTASLAIGADGTIQIETNTSGKFSIDVQGYYTSTANGVAAGGFVSVPGTRIVDTRSGTGAPKATIFSGGSVTVQVGGQGGVPADASAVVANFIVINRATTSGTITPYMTSSTRPATAMKYTGGAGVLTGVTSQIGLDSSGRLTVYNAGSTVDLLIDVQGYFTSDGSGAAFTAAAGGLYDTPSAMSAGSTVTFSAAGVNGIPAMGTGIVAVAVQITAINSSGSSGNALLWASGTTRPGTASISFGNNIQSNMAIVPLGADGNISLYSTTNTNYQILFEGWYSDPSADMRVAPATVTCPSGYADGSWTTSIPQEDLECTVTAPIAPSDDGSVNVLIDGDLTATFSLSSTDVTTGTFDVPASAGQHVIVAEAQGDAYAPPTESDYSLGFGDWANAPIVPNFYPGTDVPTTPTLLVSSDGDQFPDDAMIRYSVYPDASSANAVFTSDWVSADDVYEVPDGILAAGTTYFWSAEVLGESGGAAVPSDVNTDRWSFNVISDTTQGNAPVLSAPGSRPNYQPDVTDRNLGNGQHAQIYDNSKLSSLYVDTAVNPMASCGVGTSGSTCNISATVTAGQSISATYGFTADQVSVALGASYSKSVSIAISETSPKMTKATSFNAYPKGARYRYKLWRYYVGLGGFKDEGYSDWKYAFYPHANYFYCVVQKK